MAAAKTIVDSVRDVVQDLLVPELKAFQVSIDSLRTEMGSIRTEMASTRTEMKLRDDKMEQIIRSGDEKNEQAIRNFSEKLDFALDIRERLATLEARLPRQ
jgi:hypothetical protein